MKVKTTAKPKSRQKNDSKKKIAKDFSAVSTESFLDEAIDTAEAVDDEDEERSEFKSNVNEISNRFLVCTNFC